MPPIVTKIPPGTTHVVTFLWRPILCAAPLEAEVRLAEIGAADTPEEFLRTVDPEAAAAKFTVEKVVRLAP